MKFNYQLSALCATVAFASSMAFGEDFFLKETQGSGKNWNTIGAWTNAAGQASTAAPSKGNSYFVAGGMHVRPFETSAVQTFGGDKLVIGSADSAGTYMNKAYNWVTIPELRLVNGFCCSAFANGQADLRARIDGTVVVESPASNPFTFKRYDNNQKGLGCAIAADISGGEGTGFKFIGGDIYQSTMTLSGDNAGYKGKIFVTTEKANEGFTLIIDSPTALGGACESEKTDAIDLTVWPSGNLVLTKNAGPLVSAANRGITANVKSGVSTGTLNITAEDGADVELAHPIAGTAKVIKKGPGRLTLSGEYSAGALSVSEGSLVLASVSAIEAAGVVNASVGIVSPSTEAFTVDGVAVDGGSVTIRYAEGNAGSCILGSSCTMTAKPLALTLKTADALYDVAEIEMMRIPQSVRTVTAGDFSFDASSLSYRLPNFDVTIRDLGNGMQGVVLVRRNPVVFRDDTNNQATFTSGGTTWSDGEVAHSGADYAITNGAVLRTTSSMFKGESLTIADGGELMMKANNQTVATTVLLPGGCISAGKSTSNSDPQWINGTVEVRGTEEKPAYFRSHNNGMPVIGGGLSGDGVLQVCPRKDSEGRSAALRASSSVFSGVICVDAVGQPQFTLFLGDFSDVIGGPASSLAYNALTMKNKTTLQPDETLTIDAQNRGILIRDNVTVNVTNGVVMTVNVPVTLNGALTKSGGGKLVLGGQAWFENAAKDGVTDVPTSDKNKLTLSAGIVEAACPAALKNVAVAVNGGSLGFDPTKDYGTLGCEPASIDVSKANLAIAITTKVEGTGYSIPVLTVDAATAEALSGKISCYDPASASKRATLKTVPAADGSGRVTFVAEWSRKGLLMIFR